MALCLLAAFAAQAATASAQSSAPVRLDPASAGQATTLLVGLDADALSSAGRPPSSIVIGLPRGMRVDTRAPARLCTRAQATGGTCPAASKVGFGRLVQSVTGFLAPGGETELAWTIAVYLGAPARSSDAAAIVLRADLLGADSVDQLLTPRLGTSVPHTSLVSGSIARRASGAYGLELRLPQVPGVFQPPAPSVVTPTRFELAIGAVRRVRQAFVRHLRVRTVGGFRTREIPDHRLVAYELLRNPQGCRGTWPADLRLAFPAGARRTALPIACVSDGAA